MDFGFYISGLHLVLQWDTILLTAGGTMLGIILGALPGLTATAGIAVLLPVTYYLSPTAAISLLLGVYCGGLYGGSISAILLDIPGAPGAIMTSLDGHPMAERGEAGRAIGISTVASFLGGFFSVFVLAAFAPPLARLALSFSAQEYFAVAIFGLAMIAYVSPESPLKGVVAGFIGLLVATVGQDPITGYPRFVFNQAGLYSGISFIPAMVGLFGMSGVLAEIEKLKGRDLFVSKLVGRIVPKLSEVVRLLPTVLRSSVIGVIVGAIPGTGGSIAAIVAYGVAKRLSRRPERFGTGCPEGIAAPESANNAVSGGTLIPTLSLGIPGDSVTAVLIGGLVLHGLQPGPLLFAQQPEFVSSVFLSLAVANVFLLIFGLGGARLFARTVLIPRYVLTPVICIFCVVGAYAARYSFFDVGTMLFFGLLGYLLKKAGFPVAPVVLGIVLGPLVEENLRRALILSGGNLLSFLTRPISAMMLAVTLFMLLLSPVLSWISSRTSSTGAQRPV